MYQSIPSLTIPPRATPGDSHVPRGRVFTSNFVARGSGFELEKFSTVLKRNRGQLEKQVFVCCFTPTFAKTSRKAVVSCHFIFADD